MPSAEEEAVIAAIQIEHRAFWMKDAATFEAQHLHSPDTLRWGYWQGGGIIMRRGWQEIGPRSLNHMARLPHPVPELAEAPLRDLQVRVGGDMAWASYIRDNPRVYLPEGLGPNGPTHNIRILERHDGRWLVAAIMLLDAHLGDEVALRVAEDGKVLWTSTKAAARLKADEHFVVRAGRLLARDRRLQARLLKAIERVARLDRHLMPQRGAIPLFLESESGATRTVWVLADVGCALVMLEDSRPLSDRIDLAAQTFALSPTQARLALTLAEGLPLAAFAEDSRISLNTARTHLKRMFEKVGVTNQAGLVRVLVSLSPPR